jgi:RNA polymerase sigma factor (sigma-70 family)
MAVNNVPFSESAAFKSMQELDDNALLREYVERGSEEAFAALVARHVNKVYSIALRQTRNPHQAEEITQAAFAILAKKSGALPKTAIVSGWLCRTAQLTAVTFLRSEIRRGRREQEAYMQTFLNETESDAWPQIAPLLDVAMAGLSETDHHAIVLRFYDGKSMREIGVALGANEETAKKRVSRAVEKLRQFFTKRGVVVPAAVLTAAISANSVQAAPAALATTATAVAIAKGATASASTLTLIKGALKIMAWAKAKSTVAVGLGVLLAAGTVTVAVKKIEKAAATSPDRWRAANLNLQTLEELPPQVRILPSAVSGPRRRAVRGSGNGSDRKIAGLGFGVPAIFAAAFARNDARIIFDFEAPTNRYDFICTLASNQGAALQNELQREFGVAAKLEMRETDVLLLTMRNPKAAGLQPSTAPRNAPGSFQGQGRGQLSGKNVALANLANDLEQRLGIPVVDETRLENGRFDFDLTWEQSGPMLNIDGLKQALSNELGLELIPGRKSVEMVVVNKPSN